MRDWREHRDLSVEGLGDRAGVSPAQISLIENRKSAGSPETLEKLADALNISMGRLFEPPPQDGEILVQALIKKEDRERFAKLLEVIDGKPFTKS